MVAVPDGVVFASAAGTLYHAKQGAGGAVDTVEAIYVLRAGDDARGLARGRNGHLYVALAGPSEVLVLGPDGSEAGRITGSEKPTALALAGARLFITEAGSRLVRGDVSALES
jgi:sugar lactone lactonase YvrE